MRSDHHPQRSRYSCALPLLAAASFFCRDIQAQEPPYRDRPLDASLRALTNQDSVIRGAALDNLKVEVREGAIVRGPQDRKVIALVFTGHEYGEGGDTILNELSRHKVHASFFLTGDFLANPAFSSLVGRLCREGHYLGPHSDKHLLYCSWEQPSKTLVTQDQFESDLKSNLSKVEKFRDAEAFPRYFVPPYEHCNPEVVNWAARLSFITLNPTPGTRSAADYTLEADRNFVPSSAIFDSIVRREEQDPHGLNGFILLLHIGTGPGRTDKFHPRLGSLLDHLAAKGYRFVTVDKLFEPQAPREKLARYLCEPEAGLPAATVRTFSMGWGAVEPSGKGQHRWLSLQATKAGGETFRVWLLTDGYPPETLSAAAKPIRRFLLQQGDSRPREFRHGLTGEAVLPSLGGWRYLLPRPVDSVGGFVPGEGFPKQVDYLGLRYRLVDETDATPAPAPPEPAVFELRPDLLVGVPSNSRQKEETRRYDGSDYTPQRLTRSDFREMAAAGLNCFRVDAEQRDWVEDLNVFYWGLGANDVPYPECLYDSRYLGPTLFLDEPAVHTRDYVIRPKLAKDEALRKTLTPQVVLEAFRDTFAHAWQEGAPASLLQGLAARPDVALGNLKFRQENLFSWETMVSTAAYQLSQDPLVPAAMVFEPPGRVGARRTLPEFNMTYGCQIPIDDPKNFIDIIYGFLRGAARATGKQWGTSIYGAVDRADAPGFLTRAYDLGATRFFFWDNAGLACVPYPECLSLARQLKLRAENRPARDLDQLRSAAETAILLPPGYNLGHVHLGRGSFWGLGELNLERTNRHGIKYREVMANFFTEIERCLRLGVTFDLLWDLPGVQPSGYREVVRIREDGKVETTENGKHSVLEHARVPTRPDGSTPKLEVSLSATQGPAPLRVTARAQVTETTTPVYYTLGTDNKGNYHNAYAAWELYGPGEEDYRSLMPPGLRPRVAKAGGIAEVTIEFTLNRPGQYRLRAATSDVAGRTTVRWASLTVTE